MGLYSSLPIVWGEAQSVAGFLQNDESHWALSVLRRHGKVMPLDSLASDQGELPLPYDAILVMAQPRALSPSENVALDDWVREGGRVLLFADPMLTAHSAYALGDPRRPQDVALLSPILTRWGLELQFDESQPSGERRGEVFGVAIPVNLAGRFAVTGNSRDCVLLFSGLGARCRIGEGHVLAIADAALLERHDGHALPDAAPALEALIDALESRN